jgi:hypothetical protein
MAAVPCKEQEKASWAITHRSVVRTWMKSASVKETTAMEALIKDSNWNLRDAPLSLRMAMLPVFKAQFASEHRDCPLALVDIYVRSQLRLQLQ